MARLIPDMSTAILEEFSGAIQPNDRMALVRLVPQGSINL